MRGCAAWATGAAALAAAAWWWTRAPRACAPRACAPRVLSAAELGGGGAGGALYLALLGSVFDVSAGAAHYGPGAPYASFVGVDRSRSFVDGEFEGPKRNRERVLDLSCADLKALFSWLDSYHKKYRYIGAVQGVYYDEDGCEREELRRVGARAAACAGEGAGREDAGYRLPACNAEWSAGGGGRVWCTTDSGGVRRAWAGVPRASARGCVCAPPAPAPAAADPRLRPYAGCAPDATACPLPHTSQ